MNKGGPKSTGMLNTTSHKQRVVNNRSNHAVVRLAIDSLLLRHFPSQLNPTILAIPILIENLIASLNVTAIIFHHDSIDIETLTLQVNMINRMILKPV